MARLNAVTIVDVFRQEQAKAVRQSTRQCVALRSSSSHDVARRDSALYRRGIVVEPMEARKVLVALFEDARQWASGKNPWLRGVLSLYLLYAFLRHVAEPLYRSWFSGITLAFHELGHLVFAPFGRTMMLLGGSLLQCLVPCGAGLYLLLRQRDYFGVAVCSFWLSFSTFELAVYVDDANRENLPLVSLGGNPEHDWSTLLTEWRCLNAAQALARTARLFASAEGIFALALAAFLLWTMWRTRGASEV